MLSRKLKDTGAILFSAGIDSTVLAYFLAEANAVDSLIFIDYGQRTAEEQFARTLATAFRLHLEPVRLQVDYKRMIPQDQWPSLFNPSFVPDGKTSRDDLANYDSPSQVESYGWIEGRNAMMLLHASIYAAYRGLSRLYWGLQQNLPELLSPTSESRGTDCNPAFMEVMNDLLFHSFSTPFRIEAPFLGLSKKHIIELGLRYNIDLINDTYSCEYTPVCNACTQCLERNKLFGEMRINANK